MQWMLLPLRRYADFQGRSRRLEYWMFTLFLTLVTLVAVLFALMTGMMNADDSQPGSFFLILLGIGTIAVIVPSIAVQVRRFHDQDKTGWLVLLAFIPYIGGIIILVFMCLPGTRGTNRFGPDPKEDVSAAFR
ncbi:DUF805 domain-containing protein [Sphingomonas sp. Y38-1Y]|uniref:DUF805 domain-containing protein n=1 Tax=Sphingomonas sp. Y38-1Y TaxID=3078265 RepID=UPI0028EDA71B|nr:DUF805 domain-containing protein [Sphingomonas sp. Y38-1Y]